MAAVMILPSWGRGSIKGISEPKSTRSAPALGHQLFDDAWGAEGRAGFEEVVGQALSRGNGLTAIRLDVAGVAGDEAGIGEALGCTAKLGGRGPLAHRLCVL